MKKIYSLIVLFFITGSTFGQGVPQFWNYNTTGAANAFPFGTTTSRKVQWRILANSLGTVTAGNNITVVYFLTGNANTATYPLINIRLKQGIAQFSGGGLYETGMTLVYTATNLVKQGVTNGWMSFTLTTPFLYDPAQPLFIEVEHDNLGLTGPTVHQTSPVGPGSGRQYGNYPNANYTGADATVAHFGIDVIPNTPCLGAPPSNTVLPISFTTCPGLTNPPVTFGTTYTLGGLNYQWQSSTLSPIGPFTSIPGATMSSMPVPTLGINTWYQAVVTCTNGGGATTTIMPSSEYLVNQTVTQNTVPYYENFEGVQVANRLPNCSWYSPTLGSTARTYIVAAPNNLIARSGTKFAAFSNTVAATSYYYTNQIWMEPGITYSASMWYQTDFTGANNWSDLSMFYGTTQTPAGLVQIASTGPAISPIYKSLSNTFSVNSPGYYYIAIRATGGAGGAPFLVWDDLAVEIPCTNVLNPVNVALLLGGTATSTVCSGNGITLSASGANTYSWNTGAATPAISFSPTTTFLYMTTGTSTLTGCTGQASQLITVKPSPIVFAFVSPSTICKGKQANLMASGATTYTWSGGGTGGNVYVSPASTQAYTVIGTTGGCTGRASVLVTVNNLPSVFAGSQSNQICVGEPIQLIGSGALSYVWVSHTGLMLLGSQPVASNMLEGQASFTLTGSDINGCQGFATTNVIVEKCTGIDKIENTANATKLYPNPSNGELTVVSEYTNYTIEITDVAGKVVMRDQSVEQTSNFSISSLAAGLYYVKVKSPSTVDVIKVVKQ